MANTVVISRTHLIYGVCLPLAVLLGYLLAEPYESGSIAVVVLVLAVLCVPLLMRWHHPLLIFSCNAAIFPYFVPGRPMLWMVVALVSLFFLVLNRSLGQDVRFFRARMVSLSLIFLAVVVLATAYSTGGVGLAFFGSRNAGGKRYLYILAAIALYFALSTIPISRKRAGLAVGVFFLSALTGLMGYLVALGGPAFYFLVELFPVEGAVDETTVTTPDFTSAGIMRLGELSSVAIGLSCFVLARYGVRGTLDLSKPWRMFLMLVALTAALYSGFRSIIILILLMFTVMFCLEGLLRTRLFPALMMLLVVTCAVALPFTQKMPLSVQRTLCFLPINVDPLVRSNAEGSTDWRVEMWKEVVPTVPRYLIRGKGYVMDPDDVYLIEEAQKRGFGSSYDGAMLAGDYHNGPLSLIIPFGLFGVGAFVWFLWASIKVLRQNYRFGDPALQTVNAFLYAYFIVRIIFFFVIFGSLYSDMAVFAGLIGLNVSLNGGVAQPRREVVIDVAEMEGAL